MLSQEYQKQIFFANQANIPGIDLGFALQPTYLKDIPISGDKLTYSDFSLRFLIDEKMENYLEVHKWMRGLGYPENVGEFTEMLKEDPSEQGLHTSDGTLLIYNS